MGRISGLRFLLPEPTPVAPAPQSSAGPGSAGMASLGLVPGCGEAAEVVERRLCPVFHQLTVQFLPHCASLSVSHSFPPSVTPSA